MARGQRTTILDEKLDGEGCGEYLKTLKAPRRTLTLERLGKLTMIIEHVENNPFPFSLAGIIGDISVFARPLSGALLFRCLFQVRRRVHMSKGFLDVSFKIF